MSNTAQKIVQALVRCRKETRSRSTDTAELDIAAMVDRLVRYDEHKVLAALDEWPTRSEWWPTTRELVVLMDEMFTPELPKIGAAQHRRHVPSEVDHQHVLASAIGQLALHNEVGLSLVEWCRQNPNGTPDRDLIEMLTRKKVENDRIEALLAGTALPRDNAEQKLRNMPANLSLTLQSTRQVMRQREAELRAQYLRVKEVA